MAWACGIYEIKCLPTGKRYIGQSVNVPNRLMSHKQKLKRNIHGNRRLQAAWNKYGQNKFVMQQLISCGISDLTFYEQLIADGFRSMGLFNFGAFTDSAKRGTVLSNQTKLRIRQAVNQPDSRRRKLKALAESFADPAFRARLSASCKEGWTGNKERRDKVSEAVKTARNDPVRRARWNDALARSKRTPEFRKAQSERSKNMSTETKAKIAESCRRYWARRKGVEGSVEVPDRLVSETST